MWQVAIGQYDGPLKHELLVRHIDIRNRFRPTFYFFLFDFNSDTCTEEMAPSQPGTAEAIIYPLFTAIPDLIMLIVLG